ncbi:MAG TPA: prepilin-type N-terminal cleavage/methylation domain-containing protein [Candidatus Margulisiibacteriota bacterium]|nr:prepilin-type N-terminal cleavage/methylation domain-containing protein [Candidatus Margulisiibacteriota bacterium]
MKKIGFTLTEILIAMVILAAVMAGLTGVFVSGSRYVIHSRSRISSAELGKYFLDPLQNDIREDSWDQVGNNLTVGIRSGVSVDLDGITYHANYDVTNQTQAPGLRKVKLTLTWTEPAPF